MSSCCSSSDDSSTGCSSSKSSTEALAPPKRYVCPSNGKEYLQVPQATVLLHIKKPWDSEKSDMKERGYYFCSDPDCDVVYFGEDDSVIQASALRTVVGVKAPNDDNAFSCYCFDVTHKEAREDASIRQYVVDKTKNGTCSCVTQNPSGRCCLKDFPKNS